MSKVLNDEIVPVEESYSWDFPELSNFIPAVGQRDALEVLLYNVDQAYTRKFDYGDRRDIEGINQFDKFETVSDRIHKKVLDVGDKLMGDAGKRRHGLFLGYVSNKLPIEPINWGCMKLYKILKPFQREHISPVRLSTRLIWYMREQGLWKADYDENGKYLGVPGIEMKKLIVYKLKRMMMVNMVTKEENTLLSTIVRQLEIEEVEQKKGDVYENFNKFLELLIAGEHYKRANIFLHPPCNGIYKSKKSKILSERDMLNVFPEFFNLTRSSKLVKYKPRIWSF